MPDADRSGRDGVALPDGTYRAAFDRYETADGVVENGLAVLLVEGDDGERRDSVALRTERVPALDGERSTTAHYRAAVEDGRVTGLTHLPESSAREHDRIAARLDQAYE